MMMDHHRFIRQNKNSNVMIGGSGSRSGSSVTTDELTASDPASPDGDFDYSNTMDGSNNSAGLHGHSAPSMQSPALHGDDGFDKITMDFDSIIANDLESSQHRKSINSDNTSVNSEMILEKLQAEMGGPSDLKGIGGISPLDHVKGKVGDIGDELDMAILDNIMDKSSRQGTKLPQESGNEQGQEGSDSNMDQLFGDNQSVSSIDKLLSSPLIDMEGHNPDSNTDDDVGTNDSGLKKVDSSESLCDSMASLPSIGKISPNASFANVNNAGMQQQEAMMLQQQQLLLQQQQQLQEQQQQQQQRNNNSSIQAIVNDQFSNLSQGNNMSGFEQEKMKLIQRLQQIENTGMPMNVNQQQQQQQQQQLLMQKQMLLQQQQQLQQQQLQQQQQQRMGAASSMPSLRSGGQTLQGAMQIQGQQNSFAMNQQMMQQQQQQQGGMAQGMMSQQMMMNMNNSNSSGNMQSSMFGNNNGNDNNANQKGNVSSVMGLKKGKDTPLLSFLRNKKRPGGTSGTSMMSMTVTQQQHLAGSSIDSMNASNHSTGTPSSSVLDAAPYDFSASSNNPLLRKQMMSNLDKSVNRMNSTRGRIGGFAGGRGLSSSIRRNMMEQMSLSKSMHVKRSPDAYESAGIISRVSSADHITSRRTSLTAGAAKAQNRRFTMSRSHNSFGNLTKGGQRRELTKSGSNRSLTGAHPSTRSLGSHDSASSLIPIKRRGSSSGFNKHKLGAGLGATRRTSSVPYMGSAVGETAASLQQRLENQQQGPQHNDGWP